MRNSLHGKIYIGIIVIFFSILLIGAIFTRIGCSNTPKIVDVVQSSITLQLRQGSNKHLHFVYSLPWEIQGNSGATLATIDNVELMFVQELGVICWVLLCTVSVEDWYPYSKYQGFYINVYDANNNILNDDPIKFGLWFDCNMKIRRSENIQYIKALYFRRIKKARIFLREQEWHRCRK